jgi:hypothetical protein
VFLHQVDPPDLADPGGHPGPAGPPAPGAGR